MFCPEPFSPSFWWVIPIMFPPHTAHFCPSQNILKPNAKDMSRELCQDPWTLNQAASLWCLKNMNSSTAVLQNTQGGIMPQQSWGCNFPTKRRKTIKQKVSLNIMLVASAWALLDLLLAQGLATAAMGKEWDVALHHLPKHPLPVCYRAHCPSSRVWGVWFDSG